MADLAVYVAAAILRHIKSTSSSSFTEAVSVSSAGRLLKTNFSADIRDEIVLGALELLLSYEVGRKTTDPFTSDFYKFDENKCDNLFEKLSEEEGTPFHKAWTLGMAWITEALGSIAKLNDEGDYSREVFIPASDRLVKLSDNHDIYIEIQEEIESTIKTVETDNQVGAELGDDRQRVAAELRSGQELIKGKNVRVLALFEVLIKPLRLLAKKFSESAVGEAAKKLIELLFQAISG